VKGPEAQVRGSFAARKWVGESSVEFHEGDRMAAADPKAGEWKHEILLRSLFALATAGLTTGVYFALALGNAENETVAYVLPAAVGFFAVVPEGIIRRSWRAGLLFGLLGCLACTLAYWATLWVVEEELYCSAAVKLTMVGLGAVWGLAAGVGSGSLAAVLAAFWLGQGGGLLAYRCFYVVANLGWSDSPVLGTYVEWAAVFLPVALAVGTGVWLGVWIGRRLGKQATDNGGTG
jgi:hypothetical protein